MTTSRCTSRLHPFALVGGLLLLLVGALWSRPAHAACSASYGKITDTSIEVRFDSASCTRTSSAIKLCLKKSWEAVGACNGGKVVYPTGPKGSFTFEGLQVNTTYKVKALYKRRQQIGGGTRWARLPLPPTTSTRPTQSGSGSGLACAAITQPVLEDSQSTALEISFRSAGGSCNPDYFVVQAKRWWNKWLDNAAINPPGGPIIVQGLEVPLGLGNGRVTALAPGTGDVHQVRVEGLANNRQHFVRVFRYDAADGRLRALPMVTLRTPRRGFFKTETETSEWTDWLDRDDPSGSGDYEGLGDFVKAGLACAAPLQVECRVRPGRRPARDLPRSARPRAPLFRGASDLRTQGEWVATCDPKAGAICVNRDQPAGLSCPDYEVRFLCEVPAS